MGQRNDGVLFNSHTRKPSPFCPLDVSIVGAGVAGLVTGYLMGRAGHKVTIFDSASEIGEVGAGIQLTPNVTRLLIRWGVGENLRKVGVVPPTFSLRRCKSCAC